MGCGQGSPGSCSGTFKPGAKALRAHIMQRFGISDIGGYVCRNIAGSSSLSDHAGGRALDIMTTDHQLGNTICQWLIDNHNAGCLGIAYLCWWNDMWKCQSRSWQGRDGCNPRGAHKNHIHLSMFEETAQSWSPDCASGGVDVGAPSWSERTPAGTPGWSDTGGPDGGGSSGGGGQNPARPQRPPNTIIPAPGAPDPLPDESKANNPTPPRPPTATPPPQVCGITEPPPVITAVNFSASAIGGLVPLDVTFTDQTQYATSWAWDLDGNQSTESILQQVHYRYHQPGNYKVGLTVANTDSSASGFLDVIVTEPEPPPAPSPDPVPPIADMPRPAEPGDTDPGFGRSTPTGRALCHAEDKNASMVSDLIRKHFPQSEWDKACNVCWCESRFNPDTTGKEYKEQGLMQIYPKVWRKEWERLGFTNMYDPDQNMRMARHIWNVAPKGGHNWTPWTCARILGYV